MKLRTAAWTGIGTLVLCFPVMSCTRNSSGNTPPSTAQDVANSTPHSSPSPAPAAAEELRAEEQSQKKTAQAAAEARPNPAPPPTILPAGTIIKVRLNEGLGTQTSHAGDKFTAVVADGVLANGQAAIPKGSSASGKVEQVQQGGKIKGSSSLSLRLTSVTVKGVPYAVSTAAFQQQAKGKGGRTTKMGVGGAAAGALIGGVAGGGKGALIGSAVGGGAGVTGSAVTGNKALEIPAESVVEFSLAQPLRLNPKSVAVEDPTR